MARKLEGLQFPATADSLADDEQDCYLPGCTGALVRTTMEMMEMEVHGMTEPSQTRRLPGPSRRAESIEPFYVMQILARAKALEAAGRDIVHMEVGEPDFDTPQPIVEAGRRALAEGRVHYTAAVGIEPLREAVAGYYASRYGVSVPPRRIVITPGATGGLQLVLAALLEAGDELLLTDPGYPCNRHYVRLFDATPRLVPVGPEQGYQFDRPTLERSWTHQTKALLAASPANPTGALLSNERLAEIHAFATTHGGRLILDEIYHGLVYDEYPQTALSLGDDVFVINSFSKYFGMTGWRIGWIVVPEDFVEVVDRLAQNMVLAVSTPAQYAALAAFEPGTIAILEERREAFRRRRDFLVPGLERLGFEIPVMPQGAFYVYADASELGDDSFALAQRFLEEAGVAATPQADFSEQLPSRHIRFAYTTSVERLAEGLTRMERLLGR